MSTPPRKVAATMVVPCRLITGSALAGMLLTRYPGSSSGEVAARKSMNEELPTMKCDAGRAAPG